MFHSYVAVYQRIVSTGWLPLRLATSTEPLALLKPRRVTWEWRPRGTPRRIPSGLARESPRGSTNLSPGVWLGRWSKNLRKTWVSNQSHGWKSAPKILRGCSQRTTALFHHLGISKLAQFWEPEDNWRTIRPCYCCIWQALPPAIKHGESWQVRKIPVRKWALIILWDIIGNIMGYTWHIDGIWLVVSAPSEKMMEFVRWDDMIFPTEWKNKKWSKPPTRYGKVIDLIARAKQKWFPFEQYRWFFHEHGHLWGFPIATH